MSELPDWALSAGADPEIGWRVGDDQIWLVLTKPGSKSAISFIVGSSGGMLEVRNVANALLSRVADGEHITIEFPTPAAAIRVAQTFIKELKS